MDYHFCTEKPCPVQDKEVFHILQSGFDSEYTKNDIYKIGEFEAKVDAKDWKVVIGSNSTEKRVLK